MRAFGKRLVRRFGIEVRRLDPNASLGLLLAMLLEELDVDCVLDVGANEGQFARMLRGEGFRGQIISFEPVAEPFSRLREHARSDPHWLTLRLALGADNGTASINVPSGTNMASFLAPEDQAKAAWSFVTNAERTEVVSMKELDTVLDELGAKLDTKRLFLKLDTQGWDIEVMKGASRSLPRVCLIQCELSFKPIYAGQPSYIEALQYFKDRGFEIAGLFPLVRDRNWGVIEADCVLVRSLPGPQIRDD